ncbi:MAG: peptidoglycan-binding protein [Bacteroidetes bacterium]|nr:peptidoglycan-binding protein [Bacteroidota bacterium]
MNYPNQIIKKGSTLKSAVKAIQLRLKELGYLSDTADGVFGNNTSTAVKLFQAQHVDQQGVSLKADGSVGAITWAVLFGVEKTPVTTTADSQLGEEIVRIAKKEVGKMEKPAGSNSGPDIKKYFDSVDIAQGYAWCVCFTYWCINQACANIGVTNKMPRTAGVLAHWNTTKAKKILAADAKNNPSLVKPGQFFMMKMGRVTGHTGIVTAVSGGFIECIEGNTNDGGSREGVGVFARKRKIADINLGFIEYKK